MIVEGWEVEGVAVIMVAMLSEFVVCIDSVAGWLSGWLAGW